MAWSTKGAIIGDLHGLQVNRHYPHHSPFICSFWEQDLSILQDFLRIYGFEGAAPKEGEDVTRTSESSYRRRLDNSGHWQLAQKGCSRMERTGWRARVLHVRPASCDRGMEPRRMRCRVRMCGDIFRSRSRSASRSRGRTLCKKVRLWRERVRVGRGASA